MDDTRTDARSDLDEATDPTAVQPADDLPWSIPVRDADPDIPQREATWWTMLSVRPAVALITLVVVAVAVTLPVWWPSDTTDDAAVLGDSVEGEGDDDGQGPADGSDLESGDDETLTPYTTLESAQVMDETTTTTTGTDTTILDEDIGTAPGAGPATEAPSAPAEPTDLPFVDPASLGATWVAQVSSVPTASGSQALAESFEKVEADMPGVVVLRGRDWPGLSDAYWVLAVPGFGSGAEAVDACVAAGKTDRDDCFAKFVDPGDGTPRVCYRDENGALAGDC